MSSEAGLEQEDSQDREDERARSIALMTAHGAVAFLMLQKVFETAEAAAGEDWAHLTVAALMGAVLAWLSIGAVGISRLALLCTSAFLFALMAIAFTAEYAHDEWARAITHVVFPHRG